MHKLYQNAVIFIYIFSRNNPKGICNSNSKIFREILIGLLAISLITLTYFLIIGLGFLTDYILYNQSCNIPLKCPINDQNYTISQLFYNNSNDIYIFLGCFMPILISFLISVLILFTLCMLILIILFVIIKEIYKSFKNTKRIIIF